MRRYHKLTPEGTRDVLFEECLQRKRVTEILTGLYASYGYECVRTPLLEYYDVFGNADAYLPQETMYKLTDQNGRLLVLCPDCTVPIARLTASRLSEEILPLRIYYHHLSYRLQSGLYGQSAEKEQTGIELIGDGSFRSDAEAVSLAVESLSRLHKEWRLELCHIGIFKALIAALPLPEETKEEIRSSIEQKNYAVLTELLAGRTEDAAAALMALPRLFGGEEVFERAAAVISEPKALMCLRELRRLYGLLREMGAADHVIVDLGLVNQAEYYTGIIFRGYFSGIGTEVLSGGRYDGLLADFGPDLPAVGFAVDTELAGRMLPPVERAVPDAVVWAASEKDLPEALLRARALVREGKTVVMSSDAGKAEAEDFVRRIGAARLLTVGEEELP